MVRGLLDGWSMSRTLLEHVVPWLRRSIGALLASGGLYLLAIDQLSPHHLPGLRWLAFLVLAAGVMSAFIGTRFRKIEVATYFAAVLFGALAVGDITFAVGARTPAKHAPTVTASN